MTKAKLNKDREERIAIEIVVDACGQEEQAMGWYYYLEEISKFPFTVVCSTKRALSTLRVKDEVDVIGMASEEVCEKERFVTISWERDSLAVPLSQLTPAETRQYKLSRRLMIGSIGYRWVISLANIRLKDETVLLTQDLMAELFQVTLQNTPYA